MTDAKRIPGFVCPQCKWFDVIQTKSCPRCHNAVQETLFSGRGKIATFTVIRYPPEGFEKESPYIVGLIDIEEGPRVLGRILAKAEELQIGKSVTYLGNSDGRLEFAL
jgi:hypothetical protein